MAEYNMKKTFVSCVKWCGTHFVGYFASVSCLCLMLIALQMILKFPFIILSSLCFIAVGGYFFINSSIDAEKKLRGVKSFRLGLIASMSCFLNALMILILNNVLPENVRVLEIPLCLVVDIVICCAMHYAYNTDVDRDKFNKIAEIDLLQRLGLTSFKDELHPGDLVLCRDKETNKPIIMPCKDRFLHTIAFGPTGSGKTSQVIIPSIKQDIQNLKAGITVIEPKGDLAEKIYAMAQYYGRPALYFNPTLDSCPTFNPLYGKEEDVIENVVTAFKMLNPDSKQYFQDMNEQLLRNALKILKRLKEDKATLIDLSSLICNPKAGRDVVARFVMQVNNKKMTESMRQENTDICNYFMSDYFADKSKTYENTSGVRSQVSKLVSNKFLRRVLNPEDKSDIDFDKHLEEGTVICISTAQGKLRELSRYLGYFIILNFQASVFRRPGNENTRRHHFLYIDEFQVYSNPGFADMLTQGRSYRVASFLATQNRALIAMGSGKAGQDFLELVSTNARNIIIYPGGNYNDAKFYSEQFGTILNRQLKTGISRKKSTPFGGGGGGPTESEHFEEKEDARFSPTQIMQLKFGEITYSIIQNNSVTPAGVGKIEYIPRDLNEILDKMVQENEIMMSVNLNPNRVRDLSNHGELKPTLNWRKIQKDYDQKKYDEEFNNKPNAFKSIQEEKPKGCRPNVEFDEVKEKAMESEKKVEADVDLTVEPVETSSLDDFDDSTEEDFDLI